MAKKALVIDVEPRLTDMLGVFLRRYGFDVSVAHDGLTGFERISRDIPDLVIMDVLLPRLRGHELCWRMKHDPALAGIPVIVMSSVYEGHAYREQAHQAGADAFVQKPVEPRVFVEKVAKLVGPLGKPRTDGKSLQDQLWEIRSKYEAELPHKIAQIEAGWNRIATAYDHDILAKVHIAAHSVVGTSSTLGLRDVAAHVKHFELLVAGVIARDEAPTEEEFVLARDLLRRTRQELLGQSPESAAAAQPPPSTRAHITVSIAPPVPVASPRAKPVIVVAQDAEVAQVVSRGIVQFGFAPRVFPSSVGVREAVAEGKARALLIDLSLPKRRGGAVELVTALREEFSVIPPVVFLGDKDIFDTRAMAARAGGEAFVAKPVDISLLVDALGALSCINEQGPYRVLIMADTDRSAEYLTRVLNAAGMTTNATSTPSDAFDAIHGLLPDVIVVDERVRQADAVDLVQVMRQHRLYGEIPFVLLSLDPRIEAQVRRVGRGADDYVDRTRGTEFLTTVVQERARRSRMLRAFAVHDPLTGLLNNNRTMEELRRSVMRAARECQEICFAKADIDGTDTINASHGAAVGDEVIRSFGTLLYDRLRRTDVVGRLGGDVFGVVMPNTRAWAAARVLDEIRSTFAANPMRVGGKGIHVAVTIGVAEFPRCEDVGSLHEAAERALAAAKHNGRNCVEIGTC